jgi:hypothetical protein
MEGDGSFKGGDCGDSFQCHLCLVRCLARSETVGIIIYGRQCCIRENPLIGRLGAIVF